MMTNPIWVIKVRMFTTRADDPKAYRSLWRMYTLLLAKEGLETYSAASDGLKSTYSNEGFRGLWRGASLALVGVSNGAIQFLGYEEAKSFGFRRKAALAASSSPGSGRSWEQAFWGAEPDKLVSAGFVERMEYVSMAIPE
jgi:solute carrier family 25 folate transporter 32